MIEEITSFNFNTTPRIIYGPNVAKDADPFSKLMGDRILLVTDRGLTNLGLYEDLLKNLEKYKSNSYVMWLDHASFIIKLGDTTIITAPAFEKNYGPMVFGPKKYIDSPLTLKELPKIDLFLLTHNHYDHMDLPTLKRLWAREVLPCGARANAVRRRG